jgi:hypothetical protein
VDGPVRAEIGASRVPGRNGAQRQRRAIDAGATMQEVFMPPCADQQTYVQSRYRASNSNSPTAERRGAAPPTRSSSSRSASRTCPSRRCCHSSTRQPARGLCPATRARPIPAVAPGDRGVRALLPASSRPGPRRASDP